MHGSYAGYFVYENLLLSELVLPYKSTLEAIKAHGGSRLYLLPPPEPVDGGRQIYVVGDLLQELSDFSDSRDGVRHASLRDFLDGFSMGEPLTVSEHPHAKPGHVMLSRVDPVEDEIWSFRCLAPAPGIRVLGRFAAKDCFIALDWDYRENIDGEEGWDALVAGCGMA